MIRERAEAWLEDRRSRFAACPRLTGIAMLLVLVGSAVGVPAFQAWLHADRFDGSAIALAFAFLSWLLGVLALVAVDQEW